MIAIVGGGRMGRALARGLVPVRLSGAAKAAYHAGLARAAGLEPAKAEAVERVLRDY